jgi:hypothetical protein
LIDIGSPIPRLVVPRFQGKRCDVSQIAYPLADVIGMLTNAKGAEILLSSDAAVPAFKNAMKSLK